MRYEHDVRHSHSGVYVCVHCGMGPRSPELECPVRLRAAFEAAEAQAERYREAFDMIRMVALPPHDVSGRDMWDKAIAMRDGRDAARAAQETKP